MARQVGQQISTLHPGQPFQVVCHLCPFLANPEENPISPSPFPNCLPHLLFPLPKYPLAFSNSKPLLSMNQTLGQTFMLSEQLVSCLTGPPF